MTIRRLFALLALPLMAACSGQGGVRSAAATAPVTVGIAAINDFHGSLEPPKQSVVAPDGKGGFLSVPAGGAAWLASAIDSVRAKYRYRLTVSAGDLIGGTPIVSSLYVDEPAIGVMNRIGLDFNAVGNHEFDHGVDELRRKQSGGCAQHTARKPCQIEAFKGAKFKFLAGNTKTVDGRALFPGTALRSFGSGRRKVTVGLIGLTLKGTSGLLPPDVASGLSFADEADSANALVAGLKAKGADAIVLLIHQGGRTTGDPGPNSCNGLTYEIRNILDRLDTRIDVVVSGHTHWDYVCDYAQYNPERPFLLTSAGLWGKLVTDITLEIDPVANRVVEQARQQCDRAVAALSFADRRDCEHCAVPQLHSARRCGRLCRALCCRGGELFAAQGWHRGRAGRTRQRGAVKHRRAAGDDDRRRPACRDYRSRGADCADEPVRGAPHAQRRGRWKCDLRRSLCGSAVQQRSGDAEPDRSGTQDDPRTGLRCRCSRTGADPFDRLQLCL